MFKSNKFFFCTFLITSLTSFATQAQDVLPYTEEQAAQGKQLYTDNCLICHGSTLSNGQFGSPLRGSFFRKNWTGKSLGELVQFSFEEMPPENKQSLETQQYADIIAYVLQRNKIEASGTPLSGEYQNLQSIMLPW